MTDPINTTTATNKTMTSALTGNSSLGKDDFLKLLVSQLQHQDPLEPAKDTEFIGQMAQFSALEQESNTAQSTSRMADQLTRSSALGLIGKTVTYEDADGNPQTGVVKRVVIAADGTATLTVGDKGGIAAGSVTQVK